MIASVSFRNFKALRNTRVALRPFNLVIGPNGSGKTSLLEALLRLRTLAALPLGGPATREVRASDPEIHFTFEAPHDAITARIGCSSEDVCDLLQVEPTGVAGWAGLREHLTRIRSHVLDHAVMALPVHRSEGGALSRNGGNLSAALLHLRDTAPASFAELTAQILRLLPEFLSLEITAQPDDRVELGLRLKEGGLVRAGELSQGMLYLLALLVLAHDPDPPRVLCIEEVDRGIHPRMLREVRDALYRLSYPAAVGLARAPVQIVATTHSPYLIDQFREHPDEIVISQKHGRAAHFERLSDRPDLPELLQEGSLGDMWFSGILGGVPDEP